MSSIPRIAYVTHQPSAITDRFIRSISQFANEHQGSKRRFLLREFEVETDADVLPPALENWSPDAVVTFVSTDQSGLFTKLAQAGVPVISNAYRPIQPNEAVVTCSKQSSFQAVHNHFQSIGIEHVAHVINDESQVQRATEQYRSFCEQHHYVPASFLLPKAIAADDMFRNHPDPDIPDTVRHWLESLPKPVGIFTFYNYVGPYLGRVCKKLSIRVPDEVAIIGADGYDVSLWSDPPITSTYFPCEEIGKETARLALEILAGRPAPNEPILTGSIDIIPRGSTTTEHLRGTDIRTAIDFIERHACEGIRVQDVVELTQCVSRRTFDKHFKQWTGKTAAEALRLRKLDEAKRMLRDTEVSITTLSRACGFCDDIEFRKVFSKAEGGSSSEYRKRYRSDSPSSADTH